MFMVAVAAHSGEYSDDNVKKVSSFMSALRECSPMVLLGGYWGLMKVVADLARALGMTTIFFLPIEREDVEVPGIPIRTGCDYRCRSVIMVRSCDAVAVLGGAVGTMIEAFLGYVMGKPVYVLTGTGMESDSLMDAFPHAFDRRGLAPLTYSDDPEALASAICRGIHVRARQRGPGDI